MCLLMAAASIALSATHTVGSEPAFNATDFSGDWDRTTAIVTYSNIPGSSRSPVNSPIADQGPTAEPPFTEAGKAMYLANKPGYGANREDFVRNDPFGRCEPTGIPRNLNVEIIVPHATFEIVQMDDRIFQFFEYRHEWREIWMDGRKLPALDEAFPKWTGHSVGRFEGDTLVVESVGFDDRTWLDKFGHPHSDQMHLVERYRRVDADTLELTMTLTDPVVYTRAWNSDTKIYKLNRAKYHDWDEQIHCIPAEEFPLQEAFGTENLIEP